jgi:hypothetical protein
MKTTFLTLILCLLTPALVSCSGFSKEYRKAAEQPIANDFTGAWDGTWRSDSNGHTGRLQCIITPDAKENHYRFHYRATWKTILSGTFTTVHEVKPDGKGRWIFSGESDLGPLQGGVYHHEGKMTPGKLDATYRSAMDNGVFELSRPAP